MFYLRVGIFLAMVAIFICAAEIVKSSVDLHYDRIWAPRVDEAEAKRQQVQDEFDRYKAEQHRAVAQLATKWAESVKQVEELEAHLEANRLASFTPVYEAARHLPAYDAGVRVPASVSGVLDRAIEAANHSRPDAGRADPPAPAAPTAQEPEGAPVPGAHALGGGSTNADWLNWSVTAADMYSQCVNQVAHLIAKYDAIRTPTVDGLVH